jgi:hypothetical protein
VLSLAHGIPDIRALLHNERRAAAFQDMRSRRESHGASPDDGNRLCFAQDDLAWMAIAISRDLGSLFAIDLIGATLRNEKANQIAHRLGIGVTDKRRCVPDLFDQAHFD